MKNLMLLIFLIIFQVDVGNTSTEENQFTINLAEEFYFTFGKKIHLKANKSNSLIVTGLGLKKVKTFHYMDTLITFDPVFYNEVWELSSPMKKKNKEKVISGGRIDKDLIPKNIKDLILQGENGIEYELSSMKIEIFGKRSRGIYIGPTIRKDSSEMRKENQELYKWLIEGVENSNKIILYDLAFKNGDLYKKIENKICFRLK